MATKTKTSCGRADILPNCPPPKIPIVAPGESEILLFFNTRHHLVYRLRNLFDENATAPVALLLLHPPLIK